jgi:hypothetical protein
MDWKALKEKDIVHIIFWDHADAKGEAGLIKFQVVGIVANVHKEGVDLAWWTNANGSHDHNTDFVSIVGGAIIKARKLK